MSENPKVEVAKGSIIHGLIAGVFLPWVVFWCYYLLVFRSEFAFNEFVIMAVKVKLLNPAFSLCLLINLAAFFVSLKTNKLLQARGILGVTVVYTIMLFVYKFLS